MKAPSLPSRVEPLEARIAPATIFIGAPDGTAFDSAVDTEYREGGTAANPNLNLPPPQTERFVDPSKLADPISSALGVPAFTSDDANNVFFIRLTSGDEVQGFTDSQNYGSLISVTKGNVIAYFVDYDKDNNYDPGELTGLSLGKDASVTLSSSLGINGDIVTNLDEHGTKLTSDDTLDMTGLVSAVHGITKLDVLGGSVKGGIFSGGDIKGLVVATNVQKILAGSAANGATFDFFGPADRPANYIPGGTLPPGVVDSPGGSGTIAFVTPAGKVGASITNAKIGSIGLDPSLNQSANGVPLFPYPSKTGYVEAGGGGFGGKGGSLSNIEITKDTNGFWLKAGDGGNGDASARKTGGGAGGDVKSIFVAGRADSDPQLNGTPNSSQPVTPIQPLSNKQPGILITAGKGGDGLATGKGGAGGGATDVLVGFEVNGKSRLASDDLLADNVLLQAGAGGTGKIGGVGGSISNSSIRVNTADVIGEREVALVGGAGGSSLVAGGKSGAGGSIIAVEVRNITAALNTEISLQAGNAGAIAGTGASAVGGSVSRATVLGFDLAVTAGNGSDGKKGGFGGGISNLTILDGASGSGEIVARNVVLNAGKGGNGLSGVGGSGGNITSTLANRTDVQSFLVNTNAQASGGVSMLGNGGKGGSVLNLFVNDGDSGNFVVGNFDVRSGSGGDGGKGGGAAGFIQNALISALNSNLALNGGLGGNATTAGKGGAGGAIVKSQLGSTGQVAGVDVTGFVGAGAGGTGKGARGAGGPGGQIANSNINVDGDVSLRAGNGGSGEDTGIGGAAGAGGSVIVSGAFGKNGSGLIQAGAAGAGGTKSGAGGSVLGNGDVSLSGLLAAKAVTIIAGNGTNGGAGGSIERTGYGSTAAALVPTPTGDIFIRAGDGSAEGKNAGAGGSLNLITGSVSSNLVTNTKTTLIAGNGGGTVLNGPATTKSANGGSITNVSLERGGAVTGQAGTVELILRAGDAGDAAGARTGAKGGDVRGVQVGAIGDATIFRSVAAGNGGSGINGGLGGTIDQLSVLDHDIGLRTGAAFGYASMGGLFVGAAGKASGGKAGLAGNATNINANSIASIVAGRAAVPEFAQTVENIYLNGNQQLLQRDNSFAANSSFQLTFGANSTVFLAKDSSVQVVEAALNALPSISIEGGLKVTAGVLVNGAPTYKVVWNTAKDQAQITGVEQQPVSPSDLVPFDSLNGLADEVVRGKANFPVVETVSGQRNLAVDETTSGTISVLARETTQGVALVTREIQRLDLNQIAAFPTGSVRIGYGGDTSGLLPQNPTAGDVDLALEGLPSIQALNGGVSNAVTVTRAGRVFTITFITPQDVPDLVTGDLVIPETQRLNLGNLATLPDSTFTLGFKNDGVTQTTTPIFAAGVTRAIIDTALESLSSIQNLTGTPGNKVTVTDGSVAGTFDIQFSQIGNLPTIDANGFVPETQTLTTLALPANGELLLGYGSSFVKIPAGFDGLAIQNALNGLDAVKASAPGNAGQVAVVFSAANTFAVTFNSIGNKLPITAEGLQREGQTLSLGTVITQPTGEYFFNITHNVPDFVVVKGSQTNLTVKTLIEGKTGSVSTTTTIQGGPNVAEVQEIDLTGVAGIVGGEYRLTFGGTSTGFLTKSGTPAAQATQIETALNGLGAGVTVAATSNSLVFVVTFTGNGDKADIRDGGAGARETQNVDLDVLGNDPTGEFVLTYGTRIAAPLSVNATAGEIDAVLEILLANAGLGGPAGNKVTVTSPGASPNGGNSYDIKFQAFEDTLTFRAVGGGKTAHEIQQLDLSAFTSVGANANYSLQFGTDSTSGLTGASTATDIDAELEQLSAISSLNGAVPGDNVTVTAAGNGKFNVEFNLFGPRTGTGTTLLSGIGALGSGQTVRLPFNATAADVQTAINAVSLPVSQVTVTPAAVAGTFSIQFAENADQPAIDFTTIVHEVQNVDVLSQGQFTLTYGFETTTPLAIDATPATVQAALQNLFGIQALSPAANDLVVIAGPNGTYTITLAGDADPLPIRGTELVPMTVSTLVEGTAVINEVQQLSYLSKRIFDATRFTQANLVGGIADINEVGANVFKFIHNGLPTNASVLPFAVGDTPIDGLVMAHVFNQEKVNFTPEARLTDGGFFDNDNVL